jgi:hypothetical protein
MHPRCRIQVSKASPVLAVFSIGSTEFFLRDRLTIQLLRGLG